MSEGATVYAVSSGVYSDYSVWCIFEREGDAQAYIAATRASSIAAGHYVEPEGSDYAPHVEEFQFWPAGVVPHGTRRD